MIFLSRATFAVICFSFMMIMVAAQVPDGFTEADLENAYLADWTAEPEAMDVIDAFVGLGHPYALEIKGSAIVDGDGFEGTFDDGVILLMEAAENGQAGAAFLLGDVYAGDYDWPEDMDMAIEYYGRAAVLAHKDETFGDIYLKKYLNLEPEVGLKSAAWNQTVLKPKFPVRTPMGWGSNGRVVLEPDEENLLMNAGKDGTYTDYDLFLIKRFAFIGNPEAMLVYGMLRLEGKGYAPNAQEGTEFLEAARAWSLGRQANPKLAIAYKFGSGNLRPDLAKYTRVKAECDRYDYEGC